MSMWRTIAGLFGLVSDRPSAPDLPTGTYWHDPDTGKTWGTDEAQWHPMAVMHLIDMLTKSIMDLDDVDSDMIPIPGQALTWDGDHWTAESASSGGPAMIGPWIYDNLEADLAGEPLWLLDGCRTALPICGHAGIECFVVTLNAAPTVGTATFHVTLNGSRTDCSVEFTDESNACLSTECEQFISTCDLIGFEVDTSVDLDPETLDATVMMRLGPPPPLDGYDGGTLIRELVEFEGGGGPEQGGSLLRELVEVEDGETTDGGTLLREEVVDP
jgi:hypothetical protein